MQEAAGLLRNRHRQQRLTRATQVGALRDVPQPVEIHVGATVDRHQPLVLPALARHELLDARHRQRTRRLDDRARILEHVLDRGADLIGIHQHDLVDVLRDRA